ncbi:uncharacterized protein LOC129288282 [Prosopis cineraria]|uniref:uncharacterized protein LOC129288282 n=1 Tax=Prosopis cineraria TaxID=364024 RepID=UPI00240EF569|nr:uncharacterized protein LOC129288282 [Prosopis cineraria]
MEFSLENKDKSERIRWGYSEEATQVRSYTCGFCQKGFSNAQALGGHMNIHRRDRARLRQQYCQENIWLSLDTTNGGNDLCHDQHQNSDYNIHKMPSIFPEAKVNIGISSEICQLPIFVRL